MAFPGIWFNSLTAPEKKFLTTRISSVKLVGLGFSPQQVARLRDYRNITEHEVIPLFCIGNPSLNGEIPYYLTQSSSGLSYALWSTVFGHDLIVNPASQDQSWNSFTQLNDLGDEADEAETVEAIVNPSHDLNVKYAECYVLLGDSVVRIIEFSSANLNKAKVFFRGIKKDGSTKSCEEAIFDDQFDMTLPTLGMINFEDYVIFVQRKHKKSSPSKYRKALRSDTLKYISLSLRELDVLGRVDRFSSVDEGDTDSALRRISSYLFFPKKYTYKEALESVVSFKRLSTAFSSSMAIKLDSLTNKVVLQKNSWIIGAFNPKSKEFDMLVNTFNDQLLELNIPFREADA